MNFKNQYILTDKEIIPPNNSVKIKINTFNLYIDKETKYKTYNNKITLIGFVFHGYNSNSEEEILKDILKLKSNERLDEIDKLCGHFVLITHDEKINIYTDASSSFKVFYGKGEGNIFVGSDPKTLLSFHNFKKHSDKEKATFYNSDYFLNNRTKVGKDCRYENMFQLVSNQKLELENLLEKRVFPRKRREEKSMEEASNLLIPIYKNIISQIEKKYTIFTSLTAGYDSRLLMATTKPISDRVKYYTFKLPHIKEDFIDFTLPRKMTKDLDLNYRLVNIKELDKGIIKEIEETYDLPKIRPFQQYNDIFPENIKPNILLVGFVSEVSKNYLERVKIKNGKDIVRAIHFPDNIYLENYYQNWLNINKKTILNYGYELLDFIHWEQDISNFAGQNTYYSNHYVNLFSIFNSREIMKIMLSVNPKYRDGKNTIFFRYLINKMWPELLNYPFNPTFKDKLILFMKKIKIYTLYKYLQIKFHKNGEV